MNITTAILMIGVSFIALVVAMFVVSICRADRARQDTFNPWEP